MMFLVGPERVSTMREIVRSGRHTLGGRSLSWASFGQIGAVAAGFIVCPDVPDGGALIATEAKPERKATTISAFLIVIFGFPKQTLHLGPPRFWAYNAPTTDVG